MSQLNYKESTVARARRVVIKVGSAVLSEAGGLRLDVIERLEPSNPNSNDSTSSL